jgi:hypothetical protein
MVITVPEEFTAGAGDDVATGAATMGVVTTGASTGAETGAETGAAAGDGELAVTPSAITANSAPTATV